MVSQVGVPEGEEDSRGGDFDGDGDGIGVKVIPAVGDGQSEGSAASGRRGHAITYPSAKPKAGSTQRAAKCGKVPDMGAWEVISPRAQREA